MSGSGWLFSGLEPGPSTGYSECMGSTDRTLQTLVATVQELSSEVRRLSSELRALQVLVVDRLAPLDPASSSPGPLGPSLHAWTPVDRSSERPVSPDPNPGASRTAPGSGTYVDPGPAGRGITEDERRAIAKRVGVWFLRCLAGQHRGPSGREENPLANRVYLVIRDYSGKVYDPPLLARNFESIKKLVKPSGFLAEEVVFAGFPSQWAAAVAADSAGFQAPVERHV